MATNRRLDPEHGDGRRAPPRRRTSTALRGFYERAIGLDDARVRRLASLAWAPATSVLVELVAAPGAAAQAAAGRPGSFTSRSSFPTGRAWAPRCGDRRGGVGAHRRLRPSGERGALHPGSGGERDRDLPRPPARGVAANGDRRAGDGLAPAGPRTRLRLRRDGAGPMAPGTHDGPRAPERRRHRRTRKTSTAGSWASSRRCAPTPARCSSSAGGYHHHLGLNTWAGEGRRGPRAGSLGLESFEVVVPDCGDGRRDRDPHLEDAGLAVERSGRRDQGRRPQLERGRDPNCLARQALEQEHERLEGPPGLLAGGRSRRCGCCTGRRRDRGPPARPPRREAPTPGARGEAGRGRPPSRSSPPRRGPRPRRRAPRRSRSSLPPRPIWATEQVGCTATDADPASDLERGEQPIVRPLDRVENLAPPRSAPRALLRAPARPPASAPARTSSRPRPAGAEPPSVHRQTDSATLRAITPWPFAYPLELHGVAQQLPATSSGIHRGSPARAETSTSACGRRPLPPSRVPKIRLMQAGMYTAAAPSLLVAGSDAGAGAGMAGGHRGTSSAAADLPRRPRHRVGDTVARAGCHPASPIVPPARRRPSCGRRARRCARRVQSPPARETP